jgi:hypothetical protein
MKVNFFNYYMKIKDDENVLISYKGPVNEKLIMEMCSDIREKLGTNEEVTQKVFAIFLELSRNLLDYSVETTARFGDYHEPIGLIILNESDEYYALTTGNLVAKEDFSSFKAKCDLINSLNRDELRQIKRSQRLRSLEVNETVDKAGIGLMRVALTSGNPLILDYVEVDEKYSFFTLSINIKRF